MPAEKIKHAFWKYLGAAFMESKDGKQAISLTRSLSLICFGYLSYLWITGGVPANTLVWTFWGLIGGKTAETMVQKYRKGAS